MNDKEKSNDWRTLNPDGSYSSTPKIQAGGTLAHFNPRSLLRANSFISKMLAVLDKQRGNWLGSAGMHTKYNDEYNENTPLNSFHPLGSILFSLGFVDREIEGKHTSLYKLKPDINVNDAQALYDRAVEAKARELGTNAA